VICLNLISVYRKDFDYTLGIWRNVLSDYYDIDKPFSLENWNKLLEDVNDILQNPPPSDDPNCQPIEPIEESEDPHVWSTEDIINMQDKLKETCDEIDFEVGTPEWIAEYQWKWKTDIVDELVEAMGRAWCACSQNISCGEFTFNHLTVGSSEDECCDKTEESTTLIGYDITLNETTKYYGEWYPSNSDSLEEAVTTGNEADQAMYRFVQVWDNMIDESNDIQELQGEIDALVVDIDSDIAYYNAVCKTLPLPAECPEYETRIQENGELAKEKQEELDKHLTIWKEEYGKMSEEEETSNTSATENWALWLGIPPRYPNDISLITDCFDPHITDVDRFRDWFKEFNPYVTSLSSLRPEIVVGIRWTKFPDDYEADESGESGCLDFEWDGETDFWCNEMNDDGETCCIEKHNIQFSVDGTPYSSELDRYIGILTHASLWSSKEIQVSIDDPAGSGWVYCRCNIQEQSCYYQFGKHLPQNCRDPIYENGDYISHIEDPPLADGPYPEGGSQHYMMRFDWGQSIGGVDNTDKQTEYLEEFTNWHDEHPEYDNRHENY